AASLPSSLVTSEDAPSNEVLPSVTGVAEAGEPASVDQGTWSGAEPISYGYQWERCDSEGHSCVPIDEATGSSYLTTATDEGHTLRVAETATNSDGQSIVHSASTARAEQHRSAEQRRKQRSGRAAHRSDGHLERRRSQLLRLSVAALQRRRRR